MVSDRELEDRPYPAEILPAICEVYLEARRQDASPLRKTQIPAADAAEILVRVSPGPGSFIPDDDDCAHVIMNAFFEQAEGSSAADVQSRPG